MSTQTTSRLTERLRPDLEQLGATVHVHAMDVDDPARCIGIAADEPVQIASMFKVPVLLEYAHQVSSGDLDPLSRVLVEVEGRAMGPTGISAMADPVEVSLRDLALSMMFVSDNAATDRMIDIVGLERIGATLRELDVGTLQVTDSCNDLFDDYAEDLGFATSAEAFERLTEVQAGGDRSEQEEFATRVEASRFFTGRDTNSSSMADLARFLAKIWRDEAGSADACAEVRAIMGKQVFRDRLASGFTDGWKIAGKTGTVTFRRGECGVVEHPDGSRYAVAVVVTRRNWSYLDPDLDRLVGTAARAAVDLIRA